MYVMSFKITKNRVYLRVVSVHDLIIDLHTYQAEKALIRVPNGDVLTDTPIKTICQSVDRLANGALVTVRSTGTPIVHRLSLDQPVHQSIASFNQTTNMQYANSQPVLELAGHNHRLNAHRYVGHEDSPAVVTNLLNIGMITLGTR